MAYLPNRSHSSKTDSDHDGSLEALLEDSRENADVAEEPGTHAPFCGVHRKRSIVIHALLLMLAATFFVLWITSTLITSCPLDPLLIYSPVNEAVEYVEIHFNGSLQSSSIFRGDASPEIDAAWKRISVDSESSLCGTCLSPDSDRALRSADKATRLSRSQFLMVGGNDTTSVTKFRPEDGGGYMSQIDVYHQIHCLDLLRKYLRRDYYAPFDVSFGSKLRPHLGHCVEIIRQKLMCTADLTMVTYDWVQGLADPYPNLSTVHQCVDYEKIIGWSDQYNAHVLASHVVKFGDATEIPEDDFFSE
ncbi:hypothetical protein BS17DRAFT_358952 [Gyrodon lividus]|nr:hypothetical protein BS17DRAFT_358952 [Gyrodon lividus]